MILWARRRRHAGGCEYFLNTGVVETFMVDDICAGFKNSIAGACFHKIDPWLKGSRFKVKG
jgi:hypothetical protein